MPPPTLKVPTTASCPPKLRYGNRHIGHSPIWSTRWSVPPWGMHSNTKGPQAVYMNGVIGTDAPSPKVEFAGVSQSTANS